MINRGIVITMSIKFFKRWCKVRKDEKGIALLFTLGILSLLLVMVLSFASNSILERKAAFNNNNRTQARLIAKSALNRAIMAVEYYLNDANASDYPNNIAFNNIVSRRTGSDIDGLDKLSTTVDSYAIFEYNSSDAPIRQVTWQYLDDGATSNPRYIGRFAYVVIPDTGKIDPSAAVDSGNGIEVDPLREGSPDKKRPGRLVSEIYLTGLDSTIFPITPSAGGNADWMSHYNVNVAGKLPEKTRWLSFEQMFSSNFLDLNSTAVTDNPLYRLRLRQWFMLYNQPDVEAYWVPDPATPNHKKLSQLRHRFNLYRPQADWDGGLGAGVNSALAVTRLLCGEKEPAVFCDTDTKTPDDCGIQYLTKICDTKGTFDTIQSRRSQIAANILDYCDGDDTPTSDVAAGNWDGSDSSKVPHYTGNERTFYINEISAEIQATVIATDDGSGTGTLNVTPSLIIKPKAEIIDIYGGLVATNYQLKLWGDRKSVV